MMEIGVFQEVFRMRSDPEMWFSLKLGVKLTHYSGLNHSLLQNFLLITLVSADQQRMFGDIPRNPVDICAVRPVFLHISIFFRGKWNLFQLALSKWTEQLNIRLVARTARRIQ